ncbi:MFS transporter [Paenibacillus medicaginis]|uniref:MFS transporter n=1 Tax=Paenibacillus medicaginis TaxID=1470560 RepID=A0ABV5BYT2_9BACL
MSLVFLLYGVVSIFSTLIGGKLATRNGMGKIRYVFLAQAVILASLYVSSGSLIGGLVSISFIALIVYLMNSTMQLYFIDWADQHVPEARDLASSLTSVAVNVGIAIGSALGGFVTTNMKLIDVSWFGGIVAIVAAVLAFINYGLERGARKANQEEDGLQGQYEAKTL